MTDITPLAGAIALKNSVKDAVTDLDAPGSAGNVRSVIVNDLRDKEIVRRTSILVKALGVRDEIAKNLKAIKQTHCTGVDQATGKETFAFNKKEVEQRNKLTGSLTKLDAAINTVLSADTAPTPADYATLEQVTAKSSK